MEYYSAIKRNTFESVQMKWMNLGPIIQSEVSQKEKDKYHILITSWQIDGKTVETVSDLILGGSKITAGGDSALKLKDAYSLEEKL